MLFTGKQLLNRYSTLFNIVLIYRTNQIKSKSNQISLLHVLSVFTRKQRNSLMRHFIIRKGNK